MNMEESWKTNTKDTILHLETCRRGCPKIYRPVCGTDGKTYANQCILKIATCESNGRIRKRSNGKCSMCVFVFSNSSQSGRKSPNGKL